MTETPIPSATLRRIASGLSMQATTRPWDKDTAHSTETEWAVFSCL